MDAKCIGCGNKFHQIQKRMKYCNIDCYKISIRSKSIYHQGNFSYFEKIDSIEKAYWLGFIFADGYINQNKSVMQLHLSVKDAYPEVGYWAKKKAGKIP